MEDLVFFAVAVTIIGAVFLFLILLIGYRYFFKVRDVSKQNNHSKPVKNIFILLIFSFLTIYSSLKGSITGFILSMVIGCVILFTIIFNKNKI